MFELCKAQQNLLKLRYSYGALNNSKCKRHQKTYAMLQNFKKVEFGCNEKEAVHLALCHSKKSVDGISEKASNRRVN